jgi:RNA recognition motif-containing protein
MAASPPPPFTSVIEVDDEEDWEAPCASKDRGDVREGEGDQPKRQAPSVPLKRGAKKTGINDELAGQTRTIYIGGIPPGTSAHDLFNQIRGAPIEGLRILPEKSCAFVDFYDPAGALCFFQRHEASKKAIMIQGKAVKVSWAKPSALSEVVQRAIRNGATRNVYLGSVECDDGDVEGKRAELRQAFAKFGAIDMVKVVPERKIAFVHMASVAAALDAVNTLSVDAQWHGKKISFGSDRCGDRPPPGVHPSLAIKRTLSNYEDDYDLEPRTKAPSNSQPSASKPTPATYRTVYIGGLPEGTRIDELCDIIRGGLIQSIRLSPEKGCAFVTFVDEPSATTFQSFFTHYGFLVRGQPAKLGWGKPSPVPGQVTAALQKGATRNLYIGNIELGKIVAEEPKTYLARLCEESFGPVETINLLTAKNVAFVTFCNLLDSVKAMAGLRQMREFAQCKIAYGKDRCAQPPRTPFFPQPPSYPQYPANYYPPPPQMIPVPYGAPSYPPPYCYAYPSHPPPNPMYNYPPPAPISPHPPPYPSYTSSLETHLQDLSTSESSHNIEDDGEEE